MNALPQAGQLTASFGLLCYDGVQTAMHVLYNQIFINEQRTGHEVAQGLLVAWLRNAWTIEFCIRSCITSGNITRKQASMVQW